MHKPNHAAKNRRAKYKAAGSYERNKIRKQLKHQKNHPNDKTLDKK